MKKIECQLASVIHAARVAGSFSYSHRSTEQGLQNAKRKLLILIVDAISQQEMATAEALQAIEPAAETDSLLVQVLAGSEVQEPWAVARAADCGACTEAASAKGGLPGACRADI